MKYHEQRNFENSSLCEVSSTPPATRILARLGLSETEVLASSSIDQPVAALQDHRWERRASAATALGKIGATTAIGPLVAALQDEYEEVRAAAARALGYLGNSVPITHLLTALQDERPLVREAAATALGKVGATTVIGPLVAALQDEYEEVRAAAAQAIGHMGNNVSIAHLVIALQDECPLVREAAVDALGIIGNREARLPLLNHIHDEEAIVRDAIAQSLMTLEHDAWQDLICNMLQEQEESVQKAARSAVNELVDLGIEIHETVAPIAPLAVALHSTQKGIQKIVLCYLIGRALDTLDKQISIEPLSTILGESGQNPATRAGVWKTLCSLAQGALLERKIMRLLEATVNDPDTAVRTEINQAVRWLTELALTLQEERVPVGDQRTILQVQDHRISVHNTTVRSLLRQALEALDEREPIGSLLAELSCPEAPKRLEVGKKLCKRTRKALMGRIPGGPLIISLRKAQEFTPIELQFGANDDEEETKEGRYVFPWGYTQPVSRRLSLPDRLQGVPLTVDAEELCCQ